jgi:hypothetical protein
MDKSRRASFQRKFCAWYCMVQTLIFWIVQVNNSLHVEFIAKQLLFAPRPSLLPPFLASYLARAGMYAQLSRMIYVPYSADKALFNTVKENHNLW